MKTLSVSLFLLLCVLTAPARATAPPAAGTTISVPTATRSSHETTLSNPTAASSASLNSIPTGPSSAGGTTVVRICTAASGTSISTGSPAGGTIPTFDPPHCHVTAPPLKSAPTCAVTDSNNLAEQICAADIATDSWWNDEIMLLSVGDVHIGGNVHISRWSPYYWGLVVFVVICCVFILIFFLVGSPPKPCLGPFESPPDPARNPFDKVKKEVKFTAVFFAQKIKNVALKVVCGKPPEPIVKNNPVDPYEQQ